MIKNQKALNVPQVLLFHWAPSAISTFFENSVQFEKKKWVGLFLPHAPVG